MPNWKKLIVSGSDATLNSINVITTGSFGGDITLTSGSFRVETFSEGLQFYNGTNYSSNRIMLTSAENMQFRAGGIFQFYRSVEILAGAAAVFKNSDNDYQVKIKNTGASGQGKLEFQDHSNNLLAFISSSGNVGIGTSASSQKLRVEGNFRINNGYFLTINGNNLNEYLYYNPTSKAVELNVSSSNLTYDPQYLIRQNGVVKAQWGWDDDLNMSGSVFFNNASGGAIRFMSGSGANDVMGLFESGSGNFGVGVLAPLHPIHADGIISGSDTYINDWGSVSASLASIQTAGALDGSGTANDVVMWSDSDTLTDAPIAISGNNATFAGKIVATSITSSGDILAGNNKAFVGSGSATRIGYSENRITVEAGGDTLIENTVGGIQITDDNNAKLEIASEIIFETSGSTEVMRLKNGKVGIGSTNPSTTLDVLGTFKAVNNTAGGDSISTFQVNSHGNIVMSRNHATSPQINTTFSSGNSTLNFTRSSQTFTKIECDNSYFSGSLAIGKKTHTSSLDVVGDIGIDGESSGIIFNKLSGFNQVYSIKSNSGNLAISKDGTDGGGSIKFRDENDRVPLEISMGLTSPDIDVNGEFKVNNRGATSMSLQVVDGNSGIGDTIIYGDLGVGTTSPAVKLHVHGDISGSATASFEKVHIKSAIAATTDVDKFLVLSGSEVKFRTGAELLSDIGGQASGNFVTLDTVQTIAASKVFSGDITLDKGATASPNLAFINGNDTRFNVVGNANDTFQITKQGNNGADFLLTGAAHYTASFITVGGSSTFGSDTFLSGSLTASYGVSIPDTGKLNIGDGNDLQLYHDGANSYIKDTGTGNLRVDATNFYVRNSGGTKIAIDALDGAEVALRYNNVRKLETTSTGVDVTGDLVVTGKVTAEEFHTEFVSSSIIYESGSTKFGDTSNDIHDFTGSLKVLSGSLTLNNNSTNTLAVNNSSNNSVNITSTNTYLGLFPASYIILGKNTLVYEGLWFNNNKPLRYVETDNSYFDLLTVSGSTNLIKFGSVGGVSTGGDIAFYNNTTEMMRLTSTGLGIGTNAPEEKLSINGGNLQLTNQRYITWYDAGDDNSGRVKIKGDEDNDTITLTVDNSNTKVLHLGTSGVGIGTTTTFTTGGSSALTVKGSRFHFGASNNELLYLRNSGSGHFQFQTYNSGNSGTLHFQPFGGTVGIGIQAPSASLHVKDTVFIGDASTTSYSLKFSRTNSGVVQESQFYSPTNNSPSAFFIEGGLFTAEAAGTSSAANSGYPYYERYYGGGSSNSYKHFGFVNSSGSFASSHLTASLVLKADGNVGIGTTGPSSLLHVWSQKSGTKKITVEATDANQAGIDFKNSVKHARLILDPSEGFFRIYDQTGTTDRFQVSGSGQIRGYQYGSGNFSGTAAYSLAVDSSGRIIETSTTSGGAVSAVTNGADDRVATFTSATALNGESGLTYNSTTGKLRVQSAANAIVELHGGAAEHGTLKFKSASIDSATMGYHQQGYFMDGANSVNPHGAFFIRGDLGLDFGSNNTGSLSIRSGSANHRPDVIVDTKVRLGIGTNNPASPLHVYNASNDQLAIFQSGDNKAFIQISDDDTTGYISSENGLFSIGRNSGVNANNININGSNKVGIGTSNPQQPLHVQGNFLQSGSNYNLTISDGSTIGGSNHLYLVANSSYALLRSTNNIVYLDANAGHKFRNGDGSTDLATLDATGSLALGSHTPAYKLDIALASSGDRLNITQGGSQKAYIDGNGQAVFYSTITSFGNTLGGGGGAFNYRGGQNIATIGHRFMHVNNVAFKATSGDQTMMLVTASVSQSSTAGYTGIAFDVTETNIGSGTNRLLDLKVGGTSKFSVDRTGTALVSNNLTVSNNTTTNLLYTDFIQTRNGTVIDFRHQDASVIMRVDTDDAKVGIGTLTPDKKLHVYEATVNEVIRVESGDAGAFIQYKDNNSSPTMPVAGASGEAFAIRTSGSESLKVHSNGKVRFNTYGSGTFTGTAVKTLQVDSSGNIIEGAVINFAPKVEYQSVAADIAANATFTLPNSLSYTVASGSFEYLEIFLDGIRLNRGIDFEEVSTTSVKTLISVPSQSVFTFKSITQL